MKTGIIRITFPISTFSDPTRNPALSSSDYSEFSFIKTKYQQVTLTQNLVYQTTDGTLTSNYLSATWNSVGRYLEISQISDSINAGSLQVTVKFIRNPLSSAGRVSGNFQVQTFIQSTKVDENLSFGKVTFSSAYVESNQSTISNDGSNLGGSITNYKYTFSTTVTLPAGTWFRMRFPSSYTFGETSCKLVEQSATLTCANNGDNVLIFNSIGASIAPDTYNLQIKNVNNPTFTGFFNNFVLECLYPGTNNVLQLFYNSMSGITIEAGQITSTSVQGSPLNMNLRIDYTIRFTPTNTIPNPGKIIIIFPTLSPTGSDPSIRQFTLDSTCRVISGLTPIDGVEQVACTTSGSIMTITKFQTFYSQQIQVKIFATNPGRAANYSPFIIRTYLYNAVDTAYYMIDENAQAGSVLISEVNSLKFVQIDFFTPLTNGTFWQQIPLDFRLYPNPDKELPLSTATVYNKISIQIPLLWRNYGGSFEYNWQGGWSPAVIFGNEPSYQDSNAASVPSYSLHVYQFNTPGTTILPKYPTGYGLGQCDLPISIQYVIMPPFGGKYLFRVLTFKAGAHYVNVPQEQDLYQMDIAIPPFPSATIDTSGSEQGDTENVLIADLTPGLSIPYEGAINFNMTTLTIYTESASKWDNKLGQTINVGVESINLPCSVYVGGKLSGFKNSVHPNLRCYVFKGSELENVILQVRGFATQINGDRLQIYIPNVRLCEDYQKGCYITVSSSYTADLIDPYILNIVKVKVVPSIQTASLITRALNTVNSPAPSFGADADQREICLFTNWDLGSTFYSTPFSAKDVIVLIFPSYRFTYRLAAVQGAGFTFGPSSGTLIYVDFYTTQETYYIIVLDQAVPVGNNLLLTYIKNANDIYDTGPLDNLAPVDQGIIIKGFYWQSQIKISFLNWARAGKYTDGGILGSTISILPNEAANSPNVPVRQIATDMEWESEVVYLMSFSNCRVIPEGGLLKVRFPNPTPNFKSIKTTCLIKTGLTGISQLSLSSSIVCQLSNDGTNNYLIVSQFQKVAQETPIQLIFRATNPVKQASTWSPGLYHITSHDETALNTQINFSHIDPVAPVVVGPSVFPTVAVWQSFIIQDKLARQGDRGYFKMLFTSPKTFARGSMMTIDFGGATGQPFTNESTTYDLEGWVMQGYIYCSINGDIAEFCERTGDIVNLKLPKSNSIDGVLANVEYELVIGFKGNDDSSTTRDGWEIGLAGDYILGAQITDGTNLVSTQKAFRNLAPSFRNFWVYSINKMNTDKTDLKCFSGGTQICGRTVVVIVFDFTNTIPDSIIVNTSETQLVVEFSTQIDSVFTNGFAKDLGTGLNQRASVPCEVKNIIPLSGYDQITCRLYLGTKPNPTQIVISKFAAMTAFTPYEIHIPDIFNPLAIKQLLQVTLRAETTITATASALKGQTIPIYENSYNLVNMTNTLQSFTFHSTPANFVLSSCTPLFSLTDIDTPASLEVCFQTSVHQLQPSDHILFQFPSTWNMPRIDLCALAPDFASVSTKCDSYNTNKQILIHVTGSLAPSTMVTANILMNTPPYRALVPETGTITGYTFWRSRLVSRFTLAQFTQSLVELDILPGSMAVTASSLVQGEVSEYTIKYQVIRDIPAGGCIQIIIPVEFKTLYKESICRNAILSGSDFDPFGYQFACDLVADTPNDYILVHDFGPFKLDYVDPLYGAQTRNGTTLFVNFRVTNPLIASPSDWGIKQWYKNQSPLNLLVAKGTTPSPTLSAAVVIQKWEKLLQTRTKLYTDDIGPLEFIIKTPYAISAGSFVHVQMPSTFLQQDDAQLFCYWDLTTFYNSKYPAHTCTIDATGLVVIEAPIQKYLDLVLTPVGSSIPINTYIMLGISSLDHYYGINGVIMPSISQFYDFVIRFPDTGSPVFTATRRIYLPHKDRFSIFEPTTLINNPNEKTVFDMYVRPSVSFSQLVLYVPVVDQEGYDLYDEDLGTGKKDGDPINCQYNVGAAQVALTCNIIFGDKSTGTHAMITINGGTFNVGTLYQIAIDEVRNPNILTDDRHVYMVLEGYSGGVLVTSEINYDFSFKYIQTANVLGLNPDPTLVTAANKYPAIVMGGSGAGPIEQNINYDFTWTQQVVNAKTGNQYYDYFIIEFPSSGFNKEPLTVTCNVGSCRLLRGWNWVVWKYNVDKASGSTVAMTVQGLENAKISSTKIHLLGYTVKNRVIVDKKYFLPLNPVTPISPTAGDFTVIAPDYPDVTKIPQAQYTRYLFQLKLPIGLEKDKGLIDFVFPSTSYLPQSFCQDTLQYPVYPSGDYISCVYTSAENAFTVSSYGDVSVSTTIQIEGWAINPSAVVTAPVFTVNIFQDAGRTQKLMSFTATGPNIAAYESVVFAKHQASYNTFVRTNTYGEFRFFMQFGMTLNENSYIELTFPNSDVTAQGQTYLACGFQTISADYESALCKVISASPLHIYIYGPIDTTLSATTQYTVYVTVQNGPQKGLYFSGSGETIFRLTTSTLQSDTYFTIYPAASFPSLATLETTFENAGSVMDMIVTVQTSVSVPPDGKIVIGFPKFADDGTATMFLSYLNKGTTNSNSPVDCAQKPLATSTFGCVITETSRKILVTLRLNAGLNSALSLLINDITMPVGTTSSQFSIEVYTADQANTILEAFVFDDFLTAYTSAIPSTIGSLTQVSSTKFTFNSINVGTAANSFSATNDRVVFKLPIGYDLSTAIFVEGTAYATTEYNGIGNIMIVRLRDTINSGVFSFTIDNIVPPTGLITNYAWYAYVVIGSIATNVATASLTFTPTAFTSASLALPATNTKSVPLALQITYVPPALLTGTKIVYVIQLQSSLAVTGIRIGMSLPCKDSLNSPLFCQLNPSGTYFSQAYANPVIIVRNIGDVAGASTNIITIYNIKEYIGKASVTLYLQSIDITGPTVVNQLLLTSVPLVAGSLTPVITAISTAFTVTSIQSYEPSVVLDLTIDANCVSGAKFSVIYDNIATQTLSLTAGTASIDDSSGSVGTCTVDATTFYTVCTLSSTPSSSLAITLTNFPNPTGVISTSDYLYEVLGIKSTLSAFQYNYYTISSPPGSPSSPFNTPTADQTTSSTIKVTFTTNLPVPALGSVFIVFAAATTATLQTKVITHQFGSTPVIAMNAAGTWITINGFSQMNTGYYEIDFSFSGTVPTITEIKSYANTFYIEDSAISQTNSIVITAPGSITVDTLNIIESQTLLIQFTTSTNLPAGSTITIDVGSVIAATYKFSVINYSQLSANPVISVSSKYIYIKSFGAFAAGQVTLKLFAVTLPTQFVSITSYNQNFDIIDQTSGSTSITAKTFLVSSAISSLTSVCFKRRETFGGNNEVLTFRLKLKTAMAVASDQLMITFPAEIDIDTMLTNKVRIKCNIGLPYAGQKYRAKKCHFQKLTKTYLVIQDYAFATGTVYDISIIRLGITNSVKYLWPFPSSPKTYYFVIDRTAKKYVQDTSTPTISTSDMIQMEVFASTATGVSFTNRDGSVNSATVMNVKFSAAGAASYMDIELPLAVDTGASVVNLFNKDLGSTQTNGLSFPCYDKAANLGTLVKYRLFFGIPAIMLPSRIRILNAASTSININIMGLLNPAAVNTMTALTIKSGNALGQFGSQRVINYAVFTYSSAPATATLPTPSFSPATASSSVTITMAGLSLLSAQSIDSEASLKFEYDPRQFKQSMSVASANTDFLSKGVVFFSTTSSTSATYTLAVTNIKTPPIIGLFTYSSYKVTEIRNRKVRKVFTVAVSQTLAAGGDFILNQLVFASSYRKSRLSVKYTFTYDLEEDQVIGNVIVITFPASYTIPVGLSCKMLYTSTLVAVQNSCASNVAQNGFIFQLNEDLASGQNFKIQVTADNPTTALTTAAFKLFFYKDSTLAELQSQPTIPGVTIIDETELEAKLWQPYSIVRFCQKDDTCPIRFSVKLANPLAKEVDTIVITNVNYVTFMIDLQTPVLELACWIGDYASYYCYQDTTTNSITIQAPVNTIIPAATTFHVYVTSWRDPRHQPTATLANMVHNFLLKPSFTQFTNTPLIFKDVQINEVHTSGGTQQIKKDWQFVNKAFNWNNFAYFCSYSTTINHHTILRVRLQMPNTMGLNSADITQPNWGRFVIYLETTNEVGQTLIPFKIDTRFIKDGQQIDCICNNCSLALNFLCYIQYGGTDVSAPASITIQPQQYTNPNSLFIFTFPKIKLPLAINYYVRVSMKAIQFNSATKFVDQLLEALTDFVFYTNPDNVVNESKIALGYPVTHFVGAPILVTWNYNIPQNQRKNTRDRTIMTITSASNEMIIEHPINPSGVLYTTSNRGNVWIYPLVKWIEIEFTVTLATGAKSVTTYDFKNMQYQITAGVDFELYTYSGGEQRDIQPYNNIPFKLPHLLFFKKFQYTVKFISQPNTITFTFQPYNKIPLGGYISVYWGSLSAALDADWVFSNNYCRIVSGLQDAQCIIIPTDLRIMIYDFSKQYDPVIDGVIKFYLKVSNSNNPGNRQDFSVTTFWDQTGFDNRVQVGGSDPTLRHMIDQDLQYVDFNVIFIDLLKLTLLERYQEDIPVCGGTRGPIVLKFQFRKDYVYPFDYIEVNFYQYINQLVGAEELICYFADTTNTALVFVKTFRCDLLPNGVIQIYAPEETTLYASKAYLLYITVRTLFSQNWGLGVVGPSMIRWTRISTSKEGAGADFYQEVAWIEAKIPPCPFDSNNFRIHSFSHEYNTASYSNAVQANANLETYFYTYINVTLATINNVIRTGGLYDQFRTRFVFEFTTHNGAFPVWDEDVTGHKYTTAQQASCGQLYNIPGNILLTDNQPFLNCTIIPAAGQMPETPSYIIMEGHGAIASGSIFNLNLGHIKNPNLITDGTVFTQIGYKKFDNNKRYQAPGHMNIHVQQLQADGQFYDINQQWRYYLVPQFLDAVAPIYYDTNQWSVTYYYRGVNSIMRNVTTNIYPLGQVLTRYRSAIVHQYSYPYQLVHYGKCKQHNYYIQSCQDTIFCAIPHGPVACIYQPWSGWVVMSNNLNTYLTPFLDPSTFMAPAINRFFNRELEGYAERRQPPFTYLYSNAKSLFRGWIYDQHRTVGRRNDENISPYPNGCGLVMETTHHDNPQNRDVLYKVGLYLATKTKWMQTIRLLAPIAFQDFQQCRVRKGVVLVDFTDIKNAIKCEITKQATNWLIEITNFYLNENANGNDGLIILEFLVTNPYDSGWTKDWTCRTFTQNNQLMIHDYVTNANGKTWVGKYIPYPNLFRVYRNTVSFQNRRASINQYAELNMRIIPNSYHPQTDSTQYTQIAIWMPLTYDIPNGGDNVCFVDHLYHTDIDGQYCQITSDRKIFVDTNKYQGLPDKCGLVSYTTTGSINSNNGVKMPSKAGDDQFQVFITSQDQSGNVSQEYSDLGASTEPAVLTAASYPAGNSFLFSTNVQMSLVEARVILQFYSPRALPAGYDTSVGISDVSQKNPIGYIDIGFNTKDDITWTGRDGWALTLVSPSDTNPFTCKSFGGGLIPKSGEKLKCKIIPSVLHHPLYPVVVRISNFQAVSVNAYIEIHLLNIPAPDYHDYSNAAWLYVEAFQIKGDGTTNYIINKSTGNLPVVTLLTNWDTWTSNRVTVSPNQVGAYSEWTFAFDQLYDGYNAYQGCFILTVPQVTFAAGTIFQMKIPNTKFILVDDGAMQATLGGVSMKTWMYEDTNQIFFQVMQTMPCGTYNPGTNVYTLNVFKITRLRNAAFKFPSPYSILIDTYSTGLLVIRSYVFLPISNPEAGSFVSTSLKLSKNYADERYVTYTYEFTPSYQVPTGSSIKIYLPQRGAVFSFPNFGNAYPQELCQVSNSTALSASVCSSTFSSAGFTLSVLADIAEQTTLKVTIVGTRNHPTYSQITLPTDFGIKIFHPTGYEINSGYFPTVTYLTPRSVSYIYLQMKGTSFFQNIIADYTFTVQSTTYLPLGGFIYILFPTNYLQKAITLTLPTPQQVTGSWTTNELIFSGSWTAGPTYYTYKMTPQFAWPAKSSLKFVFNSFPNPITTINTSVFQAYTMYDSKQVDITDPTDLSLFFTYYQQPDAMDVSFSFAPKNEGILSSYSLQFTSKTDVDAGSFIQLTFDSSIYPSNLSTSAKSVSCMIDGVAATCSATDSVLTVKIDSAVAAKTPFTLVINDVMNPTQGSTVIVGQITNGTKIKSYNSNIGPVVTKSTPNDLSMTGLTTTSTALGSKASFSICVTTSQPISISTAVYIYFPSQFPFKGTYPCSITSQHSNTELPYAKTSTSPNCSTQNSQKRMVITGQTAAKTSSNTANLCYQIDGVENPSLAGETDNFQVQIFDTVNQQILFETSGLTSSKTTLSFKRDGYQILVSSIPDLPKGVTSNDIDIELEIAVSYKITAIPYLKNFEFIPPIIVFDPTKGKLQTFKIKPLNIAEVGSKQIIWTKSEGESNKKFSEIPDTSFNFIAAPNANSLKAVLQTRVSRTALKSTSLPIEIRLNQPSSNVLTINYFTKNHLQDSKISFSPQSLVFKPGEVSKSFRYSTKAGAVSGQILFELDSVYSSIYVMPYNTLSFEILDVDTIAPKVINYYIESLDRTYLYLRISSNESVVIYSMMTLLGTEVPTVEELKTNTLRKTTGRITNVLEIYASNSSFVAPFTKDYIYYDTYLNYDTLTEQTDYLLYFFAEDLSGNASPVYNFTFSTLAKHIPVHFTLRVNETIADDTIFSAFGLITTFTSQRFSFVSKPSKYTIPENIETQVQSIIDTVSMDYDFILLPNKTSNEKRPIQTVALLQDSFDLLQSELSTGFKFNVLDPSFNINEHAYEMYVIPQEIKNKPVLVNVDEESASFLLTLKYSGIGYGIVQLATAPSPTSAQIRNGLNSSNYLLDSASFSKNTFTFNTLQSEDKQNVTKTFKFSGLLDNSQYIAYFTGENNQLVNPDLLPTNKIVSIKFTTTREAITIPDWFRGAVISSGYRISISIVIYLLLLIIALI